MKFAFEVANEIAQNREHLILELVDRTVSIAEIAFEKAAEYGCYNVDIEVPNVAEELQHLLPDYERKTVEHFEDYGYLIAYIAPWRWFISCDPEQWESE